MRYAKSCNHLFIKYHATGDAMSSDIITSFIKSFDNNNTTPFVLAPKTFLMPTSFFLRSAVYAARPNKPRHPTKMAMPVNIHSSDFNLSSALYICSKFSSRNLYSSGYSGENLFHTFFTELIVFDMPAVFIFTATFHAASGKICSTVVSTLSYKLL